MTGESKRSVFTKFWEHAVERTEEEIEELRQGGLLREDPPAAPAGSTPPPPGKPPAGTLPGDTKKEQ